MNSYADKIARLLRKAESTTPAEAEALVSRAQELMVTWAVDDAMLEQAREGNAQTLEEIVQDEIAYTGSYRKALFDIGSAIARSNDCRTLIYERPKRGPLPAATVLTIVGHQGDVNRVKMLDSSLQIQAVSAMNAWWRSPETTTQMEHESGWERYAARREFLFGFARGLYAQLQVARREGVAEAARERDDVDTESVALVLRNRRDRVDDWVDEKYGRLRAASRRQHQYGGNNAAGAGHRAGRTANVGRPSVGGNRGQIEGGR